MFKNAFLFEGRIRRSEYLLSVIISYVAIFAVASLADLINNDFVFLALLPVLWFFIAQRTKRCHDRGNPGIWQLIPYYGFWMLLGDSEIGPNEYGPNPKGIGNYDFDSVNEFGKHLHS